MNEQIFISLLAAGFKKRKLSDYGVPAIFQDTSFVSELLPFCDKSGTNGVLIFTANNQSRAVLYELKKLKAAKHGSLKPVVCDFCYTLQPGTRIAIIGFALNREKTRILSHYVCADLGCSLHVRGLTDVLDFAKTQIRENITIDDRINRLITKTTAIFAANGSKAI